MKLQWNGTNFVSCSLHLAQSGYGGCWVGSNRSYLLGTDWETS
jgi:hypothetical protein